MRDLIVRERSDLTLAILRLRNGDDAHTRFRETLGLPLPVDPNTMSEGATISACWIAPGEWLLISETTIALERISSACGGVVHHVADVTHGRTVLELTGKSVRDVLATACSLDLHDRVFPSGRCATTLFAQVVTFIARRDDAFTLVTDTSYAGHLQAWLADAEN